MTDSNGEFIFKRMMDYILKDDFHNAKMSIMSDLSKIDNNPLTNVVIMSSQDVISLIKNAAGFHFMSQNIQQYYDNPEKALIDYK